MNALRNSIYNIAGLLVFMIAQQAAAQDLSYVQSIKAKVLSAPSFKASVLGEASRGTALKSYGREGSWVKINFYGKTGYVAAILLSTSPPLSRLTLFNAEGAEFKQGVRRRASTYTSAAAARGLAADDRRRLSDEEKIDYQGLEKMEKYTVPETELVRFREGGNI